MVVRCEQRFLHGFSLTTTTAETLRWDDFHPSFPPSFPLPLLSIITTTIRSRNSLFRGVIPPHLSSLLPVRLPWSGIFMAPQNWSGQMHTLPSQHANALPRPFTLPLPPLPSSLLLLPPSLPPAPPSLPPSTHPGRPTWRCRQPRRTICPPADRRPRCRGYSAVHGGGQGNGMKRE